MLSVKTITAFEDDVTSAHVLDEWLGRAKAAKPRKKKGESLRTVTIEIAVCEIEALEQLLLDEARTS